jgi:hypothetical protein
VQKESKTSKHLPDTWYFYTLFIKQTKRLKNTKLFKR